MDDTDLLRRIADRDRDAYAELFRRYAPRVNGFLRQSLPPAKAEEVLQDVMLRLWQKAPTYQPERAAPVTWIFTIARNARIDAQRRGGRAEPDPEDPMWVPSSPEAPDRVVEQAASDARVRVALQELPPSQLEVLERAYVQGQSLSEIAEALAIPLGTVKSRVRLAMDRLRALLPE
jgi:RNA polymerase sigma-70 factor (ECF subfamily)